MRQVALLLTLLVWSGIAYSEQCAMPKSPRYVEINDSELLLSVMRLNGRPVTDSIDLYQHNDALLVSATMFAEALSLSWQVNLAEREIHSSDARWCEFTLALAANGEGEMVWAQDAFDLYLDIRLLATLLPLRADYDYSLLQLNLTSSEPEAFSQATSFAQIPNFSSQQAGIPDRVVDDTYATLTSPLINYRLNALVSDAGNNSLQGNVNASMDLLHHATDLRVNVSDQGSQHYLNFSRHLDVGQGLRIADGISYAAGDIQLQRDELVNRTRQALGAVIYTGNDASRRSFSATTIDAQVLPGWRVQLFRNGQFVAEQFSSDENRVLFENVETYYGENFFELKLYGPQGQQESQTRTITVGRDQISPGQLDFMLGASDNGRRLLDGDISAVQAYKTANARLAFGLNDFSSLSGSFQRLWNDEESNSYWTTGLDAQFLGSLLTVELTNQQNAGYGTFVGVTGRASRNTRFNLSTRFFNDFTSEAYPETLGLERETQIRLNGRLDWWGGTGWNLYAQQRGYTEFEDNQSVGVSINRNLLGGTFSGGVTYNDWPVGSGLDSRIYYARSVGEWQVSGAAQLSTAEGLALDDLYVSLRWPQTLTQYRETRLQYRSFPDDEEVLLRHQHNWRLDPVNVSMGGSITDAGEWTLNLSVTGDLNYNAAGGSLDLYRSYGSKASRLSVLTFLDDNRNGQYDEGDIPLPDVRVRGHAGWRDIHSNTNGEMELISGRYSTVVSIDEASLPDPFMYASDRSVEVATHPGGTTRVILPVVTYNDVEGAVYIKRGSESRGLGKAPIVFVQAGEVVAETVTESDGYFYVGELSPGPYQITVAEDYLTSNSLIATNLPVDIRAPNEGDAIRLNDIILQDREEYAATQASGAQKDTESYKTEPGYVVQVGIFRKAGSIYEVMKQLPVAPDHIAVYRHHERGLSYVTIGQFDSIAAAKPMLSALARVPVFSHAFVRPASRFRGSEWNKESVLSGIHDRISDSHRKVLAVNESRQYCQLASYRALTSINPAILSARPELLLVYRHRDKQTFYTLLAAKPERQSGCHDTYLDHQYRGMPFAVSGIHLRQSLALPVEISPP